MRHYGRAAQVLRELGYIRPGFPMLGRRGVAEGRWIVGILLVVAFCLVVFLLLLGAS